MTRYRRAPNFGLPHEPEKSKDINLHPIIISNHSPITLSWTTNNVHLKRAESPDRNWDEPNSAAWDNDEHTEIISIAAIDVSKY